MGGKTSNSSQQVKIPPEVLAQYANVNAIANQAAQTPFQTYGGEFVAPVNDNQNAGIAATNSAAGQAQPYFQQATGQLGDAQNTGTNYINAATGAIGNGTSSAAPLQASAAQNYSSGLAGAQPYNQAATALTAAGAGPANLGSLNTGQYLSPYLGYVVGNTAQLLNQQNQQAMSGQTGNAISQGAFGGDRAGIAAAALQGQQTLNEGNVLGGLLNQGYTQAQGVAQQQQGAQLSAEQANLARLSGAGAQLAGIGQQGYAQATGTGNAQAALGQQEYGQGANTATTLAGLGNQAYTQGANTATTLAGLGSGAQTAALQGAQAQLAAGQVQQQTQQAQDTAEYNQFLQQQSYPFQTAQFLANIAEGTGALSGSTTTTAQPGGFFSDERLKEDIEPIGKTFDGTNVVRFRYKGDPRKQIGFIAQDIEKKNPKAVGLAAGYKTVDYGQATDAAAKKGHFAEGGVVPRQRYAMGGDPQAFSYLNPAGANPIDIAALLQSQEQMYAPHSEAGLYGGSAEGGPYGGKGRVPAATLPVSHLMTAGALPKQVSGLDQATQIAGLAKDTESGVDWAKKQFGSDTPASIQSDPLAGSTDQAAGSAYDAAFNGVGLDGSYQSRGGVVGYADGGDVNTDTPSDPYGGVPGANQLNIPNTASTAKLATASGTPGAPQSGLSQLADIAKIAGTIAMLKRGGVARRASGGLAGRKGYADGGDVNTDMPSDPYGGVSGADRLDIPDTAPTAKLATASGTPGAPQSGLSQLADVAKIAATIAAFKRGGVARRKGFLDGGTPGGGTLGDLVEDANAGSDPSDDTITKPVPFSDSVLGRALANLPPAPSTADIMRLKATEEPGATAAIAENDPHSLSGRLADAATASARADASNSARNAYLKQATSPHVLAPQSHPSGGVAPTPSISPKIAQGLGAAASGDSATENALYDPSTPNGAVGALSEALAAQESGKELPEILGPIGHVLEAPFKAAYNWYTAPQGGVAPSSGPADAVPKPGVAHAAAPAVTAPRATGTPMAASNPRPTTGGVAPVSDATVARIANAKTAPSQFGGDDATLQSVPVTQQAMAGLAPQTDVAVPAASPALAQSVGDGISHALGSAYDGATEKGGWLDNLTKTQNLIPLLAGIGAMGTAPTRSLGVALAAGLKAGAKAYPEVQTQQAELGLTQAQTQQTNANAWAQMQGRLLPGQVMLQGPDPNGDASKNIQGPDGKPWHLAFQADLMPSAAASTQQGQSSQQHAYLGAAGMDSATNALRAYSTLPDSAKAASQAQYLTLKNAGQTATQNIMRLDKMASELTATQGTSLASGALDPFKADLAAKYNSAIDSFGFLSPEQRESLKSDVPSLSAYQIAQKLATTNSFQQVGSANERSFGALNAAMHATPNPTMTYQAAMSMLADQRVRDQQDIDMSRYLDEYNNVGARGTRQFNASDAVSAFQQDHPQSGAANSYEAQRNNLYNFWTATKDGKPIAPQLLAALQNTSDPAALAKAEAQIDAKYGKGFHRYLLGGNL